MFNKVTLIDNIILFPEQFARLGSCAKTVELGLGLSTEEIEKRLKLFELSGAKVDCITECGSERLTDDQLIEKLADSDCLITCWQNLTSNVLKKLAGRLKLVLYWTDTIRADQQAAKEYGVTIDYIPDYGTYAVSEYVFACLFEMLRRPSYHHKRARSGSYDYENFKTARKGILLTEEIYEETLNGKHLGIAGLGRIGERVATIGKAGFGMDVSYFSRAPKLEPEKRLQLAYVSLEELFAKSDIVSAHFPPDIESTVITRELLSLLRPESIFINTGTARSVDYDALIEFLEAGRFRAIVDVFPGIPDRKRLNRISNLFFTYRSAWYTRQSLLRKGGMLLGKLEYYAKTLGTSL